MGLCQEARMSRIPRGLPRSPGCGRETQIDLHGAVSTRKNSTGLDPWAVFRPDYLGGRRQRALHQPEIYRQYQIWFYRYPTGGAVLESAAKLREQLLVAREMFDPAHKDKSLERMVLVGHSMGGLLSEASGYLFLRHSLAAGGKATTGSSPRNGVDAYTART